MIDPAQRWARLSLATTNMNNRFAFFAFTLSFFVSLAVTPVFTGASLPLRKQGSAGWAAAEKFEIPPKAALPDGYILRGVEGKLVSFDANKGSREAGSQGWFFEFNSAVKHDKDVLKAGTRLKLLPSSTLEKMVADVNNRSLAPAPFDRAQSMPVAGATSATGAEANYRLWARVTKYKDRNFIFPEYFLPLGEQIQNSEFRIQNSELAIPKEILEKLEGRRTVPRRRIGQPAFGGPIKQNYVLANRTGFIQYPEASIQKPVSRSQFVFDALGRNIQPASGGLRLLPCQVLELAQQIQAAEPDPVRFKIAGIVTEYKGQCFLLLQQAIRVYSHDNFGR